MTLFYSPKRESRYRIFSFMHVNLAIVTMSVWIFLLPELAMAATLYAKQDGVKVTAEKSPTSDVVTTLTLGESVTILNKAGRLARVETTNGKTGWVFTFRLSSTKPKGKRGSGLSGLTGRRKIAARESRTGGSIRGLKESTEQYAKDKKIKQKHRDAVDRMEAFSVTPDELMQFKKAGNVGEYSGGAQ